MGNIFTRKALNDIMGNEGLTPEQRTEQVFSLYGRALDDGYIGKAAAAQAQQTALENARAEWEKGVKAPDPKESEAYRALQGQFDAYQAMQAARAGADYAQVKPKFFETVYGMIDRGEGAPSVAEQLAGIRRDFEEYFAAAPAEAAGRMPAVVLPSGNPGASGATLTLSEAMVRANAGERVDIAMIGK